MTNPILSLPCEHIFCWSNGLKQDGTIDKQFEGIKQKWSKERATAEMEKEAYQGTTVISVLRNIPLLEGMICVDIDEPCTLEEVYEAYPVLRDTLYTTGNNKGWHFYFYNDHAQNSVDCLNTIKGDIITTQMFEREKEWFGKMRQLPDDDKKTLLKREHFIEQWNRDARLVVRKFNTERAEFLDYLKFNLLQATEYNDWRNVGFALHNTFEHEGLDLFHAYSKLDMDKYDFRKTNEFYNNIKRTDGKKITFNTIRGMAKNKNREVFKSILKVHTPDRELAQNDNEAADLVLTYLKDKLLFSNQHFYKYGNIWISDKDKIQSALQTYIMGLQIFKPIDKKEILYWANFSAAEKLVKCVLQRVSLTSTDYSIFHTTTKHRICFIDGCLDFKAKRFYTWDQIDFEYYPVVQVQMEFNEPCRDAMSDIVTKVLEPLFGEQLPLALRYLSRSIAGCIEDKNFATYLGNRNCGKGALFTLMKAFGDYVGAFPLKNILCERNGKGGETARDLYWLMEFEFMRIAISQEIPEELVGMKLKSETVKKICSGGDTQIARRNYDKRDTHFEVEASLLMMGNHPIGMDGDVLEHHLGFGSAVQYKTQDFIDQVRAEHGDLAVKKYRVADPNIKEKCSSLKWRLAFIHLLYESFTEEQITVETEVNVSNPLLAQFNEGWIITGDKEDIVLASDMDYLGKKWKAELKMMGVEHKKSFKAEFRNKWVFIGIRRKEAEPDEGAGPQMI